MSDRIITGNVPASAEVLKVAAYAAFESALTVTFMRSATAEDTVNKEQAKADYLREEIPGNANPYIPWSNSAEFQCPTCDAFITASQEHPLHPEDQRLLEQYPARMDDIM